MGMKKIITVLLAAVLLVCVLPLGAKAAARAALTATADVVNAKPGDTVKITVAIVNNPGHLAGEVRMTAPEGLTLTRFSAKISGTAAYVPTAMINWAGTRPYTGDITLFVATYTVDADAKAGDYTVTASPKKEASFYTDAGTTFAVESGSVCIHICADDDGDGACDAPPVDPAPAKPTQVVNVISGVRISWDVVPGVEKYGVWRSETGKNGTYKWLGNPAATHFTDITAVSGKTYYYRITTVDPLHNTHSAKSDASGIVFVSTPDIIGRANTADGIKLSWNKIDGATGYAIYRKSYDGTDAWARVATISGNSTFSWVDTSVKNANGAVYKYTIRALAGANMKTLSGCRSTGLTMVRLCSQVLSSAVKANSTSVKCSWTTSKVVDGYEVRFMVDGEVYETFTVGNYKTGVKTFTGLKPGQTYKIQVRTYKKVDGVGTFYSAWSTAKYAET